MALHLSLGCDVRGSPRASISLMKLLVAVMKGIQVYLLPEPHVLLR